MKLQFKKQTFTKVFGIQPDVDKYLYLEHTSLLGLDDVNNEVLPIFNGASKISTWQPLTLDWLRHDDSDDLIKPMIAAWGSCTYVVRHDIASLFKDTLGDCCEFLPVNVDNSIWYALNVTSKLDALHTELCEINYKPNGRVHRTRPYKRFVIDRAKVSTPRLFKLSGSPISIYTSNTDNSFLNLVTKNEFTGVSFYEVESV
ncbi:hypothetical protein AB3A94_002436 [Vibrio alginolyticus]|uniref:hypothetical protein n=1 Tax=Vibrio TaxID=662 RepID=UPI00124D04BC|nr:MULTISPECIES: hypothetical protein [Vibrio]MDW1793847.1 hypothetical protein [Vibrio sp. Vb2297]MDW2152565.1 hypothetical protein [Vibrio sp. 2092]KAB2115282.1 hypothetical protein F6475_15860 [Vibrio alginolyticus]MBS9923935.1 hypothetical protein [Vibrio alginolyticus]MBS9970890.1 hypothetical protein [Vibrio alginolyticus]